MKQKVTTQMSQNHSKYSFPMKTEDNKGKVDVNFLHQIRQENLETVRIPHIEKTLFTK